MPDATTPKPPAAVFGVAGRPDVVANSLSPRMMAAAFAELGLDAYYVPLAIRERSAAKALRALPRLGFRGCNVTMPYKSIAAEVAHTRSPRVELTGVANTLLVAPDGTIHAEATDGTGMAAAIAARDISLAGGHVVLLGAGGAAMDAALACIDAGAARIDVWNRTESRASELVDRLRNIAPAVDLQVHRRMPIGEPAHVLIGCVPADSLDSRSLTMPDSGTLVVDFAYRQDRQPTPLMVAARHQSVRGIDGRELLVRQGAAAFTLWFGVEAPIEVMTRAVA
ncbi:MAG: shikimate dehydrogenase [Thermoleophilia bacterium]|nr:shikimate dehydrogenase [Thermoleophilia bacterium]